MPVRWKFLVGGKSIYFLQRAIGFRHDVSWVRKLVAAAEERNRGENAISESACWYVSEMVGLRPRPPSLSFEIHLLKRFGKLPFPSKLVVHGPKPRITFLGSTAAGLVSPEWGNLIFSAGQTLVAADSGRSRAELCGNIRNIRMGTRCCTAEAEVHSLDISWFACCHRYFLWYHPSCTTQVQILLAVVSAQ